MPNLRTFALPDAGEGLTDAEIVRWLVAVGDEVQINQPVVEIETAKSLVELPCPYDGVVHDLCASEGDVIPVGAPILVVDSQAEVPVAEPQVDGGQTLRPLVGYGPSVLRRSTSVSAASGLANAPQLRVPQPILAKPPVRQFAKDLGIDLATVRATGPGGIVTREDVTAAQESQAPRQLATYPADDQPWLDGGTVSSDGRHTRVPIRSVRRRTAEAMVTSAFTAPHVSVFHTIDVTAMMALVEDLRQDKEFADVRVTPLLVVAKALLLAVQRHPEINATWDDEAQEIVYKHYVNLGIAVATDRGLVVPNIKDAHRMKLHELAVSLGDLTRTARQGKTRPDQVSDGTITITNVGAFAIDTGTPILNPGEAAILAFGSIRKQPWVHKNKVRPRWVTQLALSFDHRLVDGGLGSTVLSDVTRVMANPAQALVWG
ncbi:MAG: 2-oxo acid dehydrogenase subunit E2 [Propionibacteriaceae bacterium]|nr:2-oxo acid dehydrogenase subunit E2 [Propionibacteriaceae bacterium]